jgi:AcrR family transcriptional regulator
MRHVPVGCPVVTITTACDQRHSRWQATHVAIREAALDLAAEHGLDGISVEMVAARAGVGYRTFFNHFSCKEEALISPGDEKAAACVEDFLARPAEETPLEALRAAMVHRAELLAEHDSTVKLRFAVLEANPELLPRFIAEFSAIEHALADAIAARCGLDPEREMYPGLLAAVAVGVLRTCVIRWRQAGWTGSLAALVVEAFDTLAAGLPAPEPAGARRGR